MPGAKKVVYMKLSFSTILEYVKELLPLDNAVVSSDNPELDARVLVFLSWGDVFYTKARNGHSYLYVFPTKLKDYGVVKYIMRTNGLQPYEHLSSYYSVKATALRSPCRGFWEKPDVRKFADSLIHIAPGDLDFGEVENRIKVLKQKMGQKIK